MQIPFESIPKEFISSTVFYDYKEPITSAVDKINKYGAVVVTKDGKYYGIVDDRTISRKGTNISKNMAIGNFASKLYALGKADTLERAIYIMYESRTKALPYIDNGNVSGIIKRETMLKAILSLHLLSEYKVETLMSTPILAIDSNSTASQAQAAMARGQVSRLLVTSGHGFGLITYKSIFGKAAKIRERAQKYSKADQRGGKSGAYASGGPKVYELSENNAHTIQYNGTVEDAIRLMVEHNISSLIVVKKEKPIGIMTVRDIFEAIIKESLVHKDNIMVSGIDKYTQEYEGDIRNALDKLDERIDRFHDLKADAIAFHVKRSKSRNYEMHLRIWLNKRGAVSVHANGYSIDSAMKDLTEKAYKFIKEKKELVQATARQSKREYDEEE